MMKVMYIGKKPAFAVLFFALICIVAAVIISNASASRLVTATESEAVPLPVLMYHSVVEKNIDWGQYVISPETFEQDAIYLKEHGYTSVSVADLVAYTTLGQPLPEKPVLITFDDGHLNNLTYILPLLEEYNMHAVVSVVGEYIERGVKENDHNPDYAYLTWDEINELVASGHVEIGNHTFAMHGHGSRNGALPMQNETVEQYQQKLTADLQKLQDSLYTNCNIRPVAFAYPFGLVDEASFAVIKELGFKASFICYEGMNYITQDPDSLLRLKRYNRPYGVNTADFMEKVLGN